MSPIAGWLVLIMGVGLVAVAIQGVGRGWLPNGPKGFKKGEGVYREKQPIGFWFFFALYLGGGIYIALYALRMLFGQAGG